MPRPIPVDLILNALVESLLELPEDHLRDLARAISAHCIDPRHVADQWCDGAGVASSADWIRRRLDRTQDWFVGLHIISAETRAMEVTIARRLADVGLALLVTQDAEDRATASLLLDASRLVVGLERTQVGLADLTAEGPFIAKSRTALDLNADAPEAEIIKAACGVLRVARDGGFQYVERMRDSGLLAEVNKREAAALAKIGIALRLGSDATVDAIIARAEVLADDEVTRTVMAQRSPHERLTWVARFNNGNGGASITLDGHTLFVSGKMADDLGDALCGWRSRRDTYKADIEKMRAERDEAIDAARALTNDLKRARDDLDGIRHSMKNADAEIAVWKAERDAAIAETVAARDELDEARDCARREVVWVPKEKTNRPAFNPGDRVVIAREAESATNPWEHSDDYLIGKIGEVRQIDDDGDVQVIVEDDRTWFAPACLDLAPPDTRTMHERLVDRGLDPAKVDASLEAKRPEFKVGDRVRFDRRVGEESNFDEAPPLGWEGVVDEDDGSELPLRVVGQRWASRDHVWWFVHEALDLITPTA